MGDAEWEPVYTGSEPIGPGTVRAAPDQLLLPPRLKSCRPAPAGGRAATPTARPPHAGSPLRF